MKSGYLSPVSLPDPPLLLITDGGQARQPLPEIALAAFRAGCRWISLREKTLTPAERAALLRDIQALAAPYGACVGLHSDKNAPGEAAHALHLPRDGDVAVARESLAGQGPGLIGLSAHDAGELSRAAEAGADYATLSPIFASQSKPGYGPPLGLTTLARLAKAAPLPVIALGGVHAGNVASCLTAGASGVAVMGEVMRAPDVQATVAAILTAFAGTRRGQG